MFLSLRFRIYVLLTEATSLRRRHGRSNSSDSVRELSPQINDQRACDVIPIRDTRGGKRSDCSRCKGRPVCRRAKKMPDIQRGVEVRHLVDVYQQILNCALPVVFSELWFLSIPESSRHI